MATITATTSPQTLDSGTSGYVTVKVTGQLPAIMRRGSDRPQTIGPSCSAVISPAGSAVTIETISGSTTVDYTITGGENGVGRTPATSTSGRVAAAAAGVGGTAWDRSLSKPIWSDGTVWRDATGTAV